MIDLPLGTVLKYKKEMYCITQGLDGVIATNVHTGTWQFVKNLNWKKFEILFQPTPTPKIGKEEVAIRVQSGNFLVFQNTQTNPQGTSYLRVLEPHGKEIAYWDANEWEENPENVIGAVCGALLLKPSQPSDYFATYDVYRKGCFVTKRFARFQSKTHAQQCLDKWNDPDGWSYLNLQTIDQQTWLNAPDDDRIDHFLIQVLIDTN